MSSSSNVHGSEASGVPSNQVSDLFPEDHEWEKEAVAFAEKIERENFGEDKTSCDKISKE